MLSAAQQVFKRIVVHNKLLSGVQADALLAKQPDPEAAIRFLMEEGNLHAKTGTQLLQLYRKKVAALAPAEAAPAPSPPAEKEQTAAPAESAAVAVTEPAPQPAPAPSAPPREAAPAGVEPVPAVAGEDAEAKQFIHRILKLALDVGASDVHITAGQVPVLRLNARLQPMDLPAISPEQCQRVLLSLLDEGRRRHFEKHFDLDFCYDGGAELGRFRTNYLLEQSGMDAIFRLIPNQLPTLDDLKMPDTVKRFTDYRVGIVLVTGPKSCGKTTTLAAMIDLINRSRSEHIVTIEDPIEFVHPCKRSHVSQREVGTHTKEFANALRAALREAPDVIMVGEMRDLETTSLAITAAETGHLVLATLHTPDTIRTIGRVLDVFPPKEQGQIRSMLSESLRGIVSQQLIPNKDGDSLELAIEILVNTTAIGNMIREDRTFQIRGLMQTGRRLGMVLLDNSLLDLVKADRIAAKEAIIRASDHAYVEKELARLNLQPEKEKKPVS